MSMSALAKTLSRRRSSDANDLLSDDVQEAAWSWVCYSQEMVRNRTKVRDETWLSSPCGHQGFRQKPAKQAGPGQEPAEKPGHGGRCDTKGFEGLQCHTEGFPHVIHALLAEFV